VNSFGVSEPPIFMGLQVFIVVLDHRSLFQVFQEYYESILLKGTSPSTMYVIYDGIMFLFFGHPILPASSAWIGSTQVRVLIEYSSAEAKLIGYPSMLWYSSQHSSVVAYSISATSDCLFLLRQ
jgi:hypothetical protein